MHVMKHPVWQNPDAHDLPWRVLGVGALVVLAVLTGALLVRLFVLLPREATGTAEQITSESSASIPTLSGPLTPGACTDESCAEAPSDQEVAAFLEAAEALTTSSLEPPFLSGGERNETPISWSVREPSDDEITVVALPTLFTPASPVQPPVAREPARPLIITPPAPDESPLSSEQLQRVLGQRAERLLVNYFQLQRVDSRGSVRKVVFDFALLTGCTVVINDIQVRADSTAVADQVADLLRTGLTQRVDSPGCAKLDQPVTGEVSLINLPAPSG